MNSNSPSSSTSPIPVPNIDSKEPVAVIPAASVAPLDGPPDGERINTFLVAPKKKGWASDDLAAGALAEMRERVGSNPFTYLVAAFSLGVVLARVMR
jgi:hypothetical protein